MLPIQKFWIYAISGFILMLAVIAFSTVYSFKQPARGIPQQSVDEGQSFNAASSVSKNAAPPTPENLPAPAKKLQKLMQDPELKPDSETALQQKIEALDKQIATLNQQLKSQGITVPERQVSTTNATAVSDTEKRSNSIKEHLNNQ